MLVAPITSCPFKVVAVSQLLLSDVDGTSYSGTISLNSWDGLILIGEGTVTETSEPTPAQDIHLKTADGTRYLKTADGKNYLKF